MQKIIVACIQMRSSNSIIDNLEVACNLIREAAGEGAEFIATPEYTTLLENSPEELLQKAQSIENDKAIPVFKSLARELKITLLIGSIPILLNKKKCANTSFLISSSGKVLSLYRKIHLFDVELNDGNSHKESIVFDHGDEAVLTNVNGVSLGLSICYDLRFPCLYADLASAGAQILAIPSSFTKITGEAHWGVLVRARAIETGSFVVAPAQGGTHLDGRQTYGHSIIVNPWGEVVKEMNSDVGFITAELDIDEVRIARERIPSLKNQRSYKVIRVK